MQIKTGFMIRLMTIFIVEISAGDTGNLLYMALIAGTLIKRDREGDSRKVTVVSGSNLTEI